MALVIEMHSVSEPWVKSFELEGNPILSLWSLCYCHYIVKILGPIDVQVE